MLGVVASVFSQSIALCMSYDVGADYVGWYIVIRADRTMTLYANDGNGIYVINEGTWSPGVADSVNAAALPPFSTPQHKIKTEKVNRYSTV